MSKFRIRTEKAKRFIGNKISRLVTSNKWFLTSKTAFLINKNSTRQPNLKYTAIDFSKWLEIPIDSERVSIENWWVSACLQQQSATNSSTWIVVEKLSKCCSVCNQIREYLRKFCTYIVGEPMLRTLK